MSIFRSLSVPVRVLGFLLLVLTLSRVLLVMWYWGRVAPTGGGWFILLQGLRFDIVLMGIVLGPALLAAPWLSGRNTGATLLRVYLVAVTVFVVFVELSTIPFIDQYDARPNYLYVEYLKYPREVFATLMASYGLLLVTVTIAALGSGWLVWRASRDVAQKATQCRRSWALLITPFLLILVLMMVRSTLDHRAVNPSTAAFSTDSMVNQLPLNSPYSLLYAIYEQHRDSAGGTVNYGKLDDSEVLRTVVEHAGLTSAVDLQSHAPTMHTQIATRQVKRPLNLVIILEESLGAEFVGSLGGKNLTPELDKLAVEGIWFEQLYATGTRSVRGIEAVISGFPPTSKRSVVKLAETQENFFTIADLLQDQGYQTSFLYGGEAQFDNMRRFFLDNGFQVTVDQNDYENPQFLGSWGVSDEDLFRRAHQYFSARGDQPFFSLVFTSSNHEPFDIPAGKVTKEPGPESGRYTAVKYADYALGRFFEQARSSDYFDNTVFLVVPDHNSRVKGAQLIPIERFHIPGVILGGTIEPRRIPGISSQVDLLPTLLSLIGVTGRLPAIGHDLTTAEYYQGAGRAQMQFNDIQAWMEPGKVVVLQPDLPIKSFLYAPGGRLSPDTEPDQAQMERALAHALWPPLMIREKAYHP
jgi:phosphoglycerol transferase MdoB-like AlkP superfamily enzyme